MEKEIPMARRNTIIDVHIRRGQHEGDEVSDNDDDLPEIGEYDPNYPLGKSYHANDRSDPSPNALDTYEISIVMNDETRRNINLKRNIIGQKPPSPPTPMPTATSSSTTEKKEEGAAEPLTICFLVTPGISRTSSNEVKKVEKEDEEKKVEEEAEVEEKAEEEGEAEEKAEEEGEAEENAEENEEESEDVSSISTNLFRSEWEMSSDDDDDEDDGENEGMEEEEQEEEEEEAGEEIFTPPAYTDRINNM